MALIFITCIFILLTVPSDIYTFDLSRHPLSSRYPTLQPVLLKSYTTYDDDGRPRSRGKYLPHFSPYVRSSPNSTKDKFKNLDMLANGRTNIKFVAEFNRPAWVVMIFPGRLSDPNKMPSLKGWKTEGELQLEGKEPVSVVVGGDYMNDTRGLYQRVYAVSKVINDTLELEISRDKMGIDGIVNGKIGTPNFLIGEKDESVPNVPKDVLKIGVQPNKKCPKELHDLWKVQHEDEKDDDIKGVNFNTYHPQIDPYYWCYYGHEHGSDPTRSGYIPKFTYVARKNKRQNESDAGFKGYLIDLDDYWFYTNLHAHVSSTRRFDTQFHTAVLAVMDKKGRLLTELSCKSDLGFAAAPAAEGGLVPLSNEDLKKKLQQEIARKVKFRRFNVIDPSDLDKRFKYREADDLLHGVYEGWEGFASELCTSSGSDRRVGLSVDIKDSATAKRKAEDTADDPPTILGHMNDGKLHPQAGLNREFKVPADNFTISEKFCAFSLQHPGGRSDADGFFYTDPYCRKLCLGPSKTCVRQKIVKGFELTISGRYIPNDIWDGSYRRRKSEKEPPSRLQNLDGSIYYNEN